MQDRRQGGADGLVGVVELGDEGGQLLAEGDRRGVHHMGAAGLHQVGMAGGLLGQPTGELGQRRQQLVVYGAHGAQVHGGGEAVVGALRAVDMIVGMHRAFAAALAAGQFVGASGDHLVDVHVALRAAAGLPDHQRELVVVLAGQHFVGGLLDQPGHLGGQLADAVIDPRGGFLDQRQGMQHRQRHAFLANGEIDQRALGLRAPVGIVRDFHGAQAIGFGAAHGVPSTCMVAGIRPWTGHTVP
ncbi:hypothetical protein D3C77_500700 [compost metagenome]